MTDLITVRLYGGSYDGREMRVERHVKEIHVYAERYVPARISGWFQFAGYVDDK